MIEFAKAVGVNILFWGGFVAFCCLYVRGTDTHRG